MWNRVFAGTITLSAALSISLAAPAAAEWPEKPIRIVVPFGAGGTADSVPRAFQMAIEQNEILPEPLTILNVGGHFSVGARRVMEADPDGYEFLVIHVALMGAAGMGAIDFGWQDFVPVAQTGQVCNVPSVSAASDYETLDDVMNAAAGSDAVLAGVNLGGVNHLTMIMLQNAMPEAKFRYVQVGGGTQVYPALVGRHVDVGTQSALEIANNTLQASGEPNPDAEIRPLAYVGPERHPRLPHIPTAIELGYDVDFCTDFWWLAPKGTPQEAIDGLADALETSMDTEIVQDFFDDKMFDPAFMRDDAFSNYLGDLWERIEPVAKQAAAN